MAATYDTVEKLVDIALAHFARFVAVNSTGSEKTALKAKIAVKDMLEEMNVVAQDQKNKSVQTTFSRLLIELDNRCSWCNAKHTGYLMHQPICDACGIKFAELHKALT